LAVLYKNQGKYEEAEPLYLRSLTIMEKLLPNHPDTAIMLGNYALFLQKMNREGEAVELERRARAIRDGLGS
jgi:tetratricopeptide (TPR) repeat protein